VSITLVVTAVSAERDAIADGIGEPQAVTVGPYGSSRRCETDGRDVVIMAGGVGPAAAAAATSYAIATREVSLVVSMGVAGSFASARLQHGDTAVASSIVAADLGAMSPERFLDLAALGLDGGATVECPPELVTLARDRIAESGLHVAVGAILTLSTMTGTTERAAELMGRHGAVAEAMEGAGVAHVAALHDLPVLEVRTISNEVGLRDRNAWDLVTALTSLGTAARALFSGPLPC
jgi:futalosine hydrolase